MEFFDTKEEVIDIQLTPYGKHLLSKGKWKPIYYEFYDDDILYDAEYAGVQEKQEEIIERIKSTKRTKTQTAFKSPESGSFLMQELAIRKKKTLYTNFLPLGNSSLINNDYPSFQIKLVSGEIESIGDSVGISGLPNSLKTINLKDLQYTITTNTIENVEDTSNIQKVFEDGSFIDIKDQEIFIDIAELGVDASVNNLEISLVEIDGNGNEIKTYFVDEQQPTKVINDILFYNENYENYNQMVLERKFDDTKFISYFLDIKVDKEIDQNVICKYLSKEEVLRLKIVEGYDIDCVDQEDINTILSINSTTLITNEG